MGLSLNAGVVESDVEPAEFVDRKIDHPLHVRIFRHVGADERRLTVEFVNFSDDLCAFFFTATSQNESTILFKVFPPPQTKH
jgi:hypothetical protein